MSIVFARHRAYGDPDLPGVPPYAIVQEWDIAIAEALKIGNRFHAARADFGVNLEGHPVFSQIDL